MLKNPTLVGDSFTVTVTRLAVTSVTNTCSIRLCVGLQSWPDIDSSWLLLGNEESCSESELLPSSPVLSSLKVLTCFPTCLSWESRVSDVGVWTATLPWLFFPNLSVKSLASSVLDLSRCGLFRIGWLDVYWVGVLGAGLGSCVLLNPVLCLAVLGTPFGWVLSIAGEVLLTLCRFRAWRLEGVFRDGKEFEGDFGRAALWSELSSFADCPLLPFVMLWTFKAATPGDLHEGVLESAPPLLMSDTESLKSETGLLCDGRLNSDGGDPTERPAVLSELFPDELCVKDPLFNPVKVKLAGMSGFLMLRKSESLGMGLKNFRGPLACRSALSSGGNGLLPRFLGGSGLATTICAFFWGTGWSSRGRGLGFGFLSRSSSSSSEDDDEDEDEDEEDEPEDEDEDDELLDFDTGGMVSCGRHACRKESHLRRQRALLVLVYTEHLSLTKIFLGRPRGLFPLLRIKSSLSCSLRNKTHYE